jgi:hypothetical protein
VSGASVSLVSVHVESPRPVWAVGAIYSLFKAIAVKSLIWTGLGLFLAVLTFISPGRGGPQLPASSSPNIQSPVKA